MKKLVLLVISIAFIFNLVNAAEKVKDAEKLPEIQSVLSGKIVDKQSGEELAGVAVRLNNSDVVCYTDFEGVFKFNNIKPGQYKLNVELISYAKLETQHIKVGSNEAHQLKINMEQDQ